MHFDQHVQPQVVGDAGELRQFFVAQGSGNKQHGIGAEGARFDDLVFVNNEVFAQKWQADRAADQAQVAGAALKVFFVGQDRKAGGAGFRVAFGNRHRIKVGADNAEAGRGFS